MQKEKLDLILSITSASVFVLLLVVAAFILFRIYLKRKNLLLLEKERMSIQFEQTLLRSKLEIQEQTFTHISREIHDNIGQVLSMVRLNLNTMAGSSDPDKINLMDELLGKAIADLRSLSHSLSTDFIRNTGWSQAVEKLFNDLTRSGRYKTHLHIEDGLPALGNDRPIILFRMVQEIINNVLRHAKADEISLVAVRKSGDIMIAIRDNGQGFDKVAVAQSSNGLQNLESRARMINAELTINSKKGEGTQVMIRINTENDE